MVVWLCGMVFSTSPWSKKHGHFFGVSISYWTTTLDTETHRAFPKRCPTLVQCVLTKKIKSWFQALPRHFGNTSFGIETHCRSLLCNNLMHCSEHNLCTKSLKLQFEAFVRWMHHVYYNILQLFCIHQNTIGMWMSPWCNVRLGDIWLFKLISFMADNFRHLRRCHFDRWDTMYTKIWINMWCSHVLKKQKRLVTCLCRVTLRVRIGAT